VLLYRNLREVIRRHSYVLEVARLHTADGEVGDRVVSDHEGGEGSKESKGRLHGVQVRFRGRPDCSLFYPCAFIACRTTCARRIVALIYKTDLATGPATHGMRSAVPKLDEYHSEKREEACS
jgi:hypothetical protein